MEMATTKITCPPGTAPLAMVYVPEQKWQELYSPEVGFCRGTIFSQLDKPFIGEEAVKNGK